MEKKNVLLSAIVNGKIKCTNVRTWEYPSFLRESAQEKDNKSAQPMLVPADRSRNETEAAEMRGTECITK